MYLRRYEQVVWVMAGAASKAKETVTVRSGSSWA